MTNYELLLKCLEWDYSKISLYKKFKVQRYSQKEMSSTKWFFINTKELINTKWELKETIKAENIDSMNYLKLYKLNKIKMSAPRLVDTVGKGEGVAN